MKSKLIVGAIYTLRNGLTTSPIRLANNGTSYKFEADVKRHPNDNEPSVMAWLPSGEYVGVGIQNRYDIIFN